MTPATYALDGEPNAGAFTLSDFLQHNEWLANEPGFADDLLTIRWLDLGETHTVDLGAHGTFTIARVS